MRLALLVVAGCGAAPAKPSVNQTNRELDGRAWASRDGGTFVYAHVDALMAFRGGVRHELPLNACLGAHVDRMFVADDGHSALGLLWEKEGHGFTVVATACDIDLATGRAVAAEPRLDRFDDESIWVRGHSGTTYLLNAHGELDVIDPSHRAARMPVRTDSARCDLVETGATAVLACGFSEPPPDDPSTYRSWIQVSELDTSVFPPVLLHARALDVPRVDGLRLSRDATQLAWWRVTSKGLTQVAVVRVATATETASFSLGAVEGALKLDFSPRGDGLAVADDMPGNSTNIRRYELVGSGATERQEFSFDEKLDAIYWLADGRILVSGVDGSALFTP